MNRIERMVAEMCPDGVEYRHLGDVATIRTGRKPEAILDEGPYPFVNGGVKASGFTSSANRSGPVTTIPSRGSVGIVGFQPADFWLGPLCYEVRATPGTMLDEFLFHFLRMRQPSLVALQQTGSIPALNKKELVAFRIAVPPIEIQWEIVDILDSFTKLEAELEARRAQYAFYRDRLLSFDFEAGGGALFEASEHLRSGGLR